MPFRMESGPRSPLVAASGPSASYPLSYGLPTEWLAKGVRRLGATSLGLIVFFCLVIALYEAVVAAGHPDIAHGFVGGTKGVVNGAVLVVVSAAMLFVTRRPGLDPHLVLDLGMVYAVVCSAGIAMQENLMSWPVSDGVRGVSWVCVWIILFSVVVPSTTGKLLLTALVSAAMGPLVAVVLVFLGKPAPDFATFIGLYAPNVAAVVFAAVASRVIHRLGKDVSEAQQLGSYQLVKRIGHGGMGEVWLAQHRRLDRQAAVKFIHPRMLQGGTPSDASTALRRFEREARATALLRCPHTIELFDFGVTDDGTYYYVMEHLAGLDLETLVGRFGPLPPERVVHLLRQACASLEEAHHLGLVHRDVKPANLFLCRLGVEFDFVKVLDFGLVRNTANPVESQGRLTADGFFGATPAYAAPEMILDGKDVDGRADLYALGCVAYWMLTGQLVFKGETPMKILMDHVKETPVPPSARTEIEVPRALEDLVMACLSKDRAARPRDARDLAERLARCDVGPPWTAERAQKWWRRHLPDLAGAPEVDLGARKASA